MLRVVVNAVSAKSGGAATYICNLFSELSTLNPQMAFIFCIPEIHKKHLQKLNNKIKIITTNAGYSSSFKRFIWDQITLRKIVKNEKADVLLSSSDFGMLFPPCKQILMIRNPLFFSPLYLKKILPFKGLFFKADFLLRRLLISVSVKFSDVVITASQSMLDDVKKNITIPGNKTVVNYFGVPAGKFTSSETKNIISKDNQINLLYISEYGDYKNLTTLLKAFMILRKQKEGNFYLTATLDPDQFPDTDATTRKVDKSLASCPFISPYITFTGPVKYEEIKKLYEKSEIFVFPSLAESFGHPLVEAMASDLPVVASDIPIHREICGEAALYFSPLDPNDLAEKIITLSDNNFLKDKLKRIGKERVRVCFGWKEHVQRLIKIIEQTVINNLNKEKI